MNRISFSSWLILLASAPGAILAREPLSEAETEIPMVLSSVGGAVDTTSGSADSLPAQSVLQENKDKWSFDDCVNWAIKNNSDVRRNALDILMADENIGEAKDAWLPSVGFSTSHSFINYPVAEAGRKGNAYTSSYGIEASWTVWEGNIRKYRLESARLLQRQQELAGADIEKDIRLGVLQGYLNILYASEAVAIAEQTLEVSKAQTERAQKLMQAGRSSKVDYAQIESQYAQDKYNLVQASGNLETAKVNLKAILEITLEKDFDIQTSNFDDSEIMATLPDMESVYRIAESWLPGIKSNDISREIYANDIKIAQAGNMPQISLSGGIGSGYTSGGEKWSTQMSHGLNEKIGLNLSVPIYDGNSTRRAVAKARLAALEYEIDRDNLLNNLSQTIENLYTEARNAQAKYLAGIKQQEAASLTADLVNRQFELGLVNPLELLTAHNNLLNARLELLQSKYMAVLSKKTIDFYANATVSLP